MEYSSGVTTTSTNYNTSKFSSTSSCSRISNNSSIPSSPSTPPSPPAPTPAAHVIASPCAACKVLRRRCAENCVLAPYFPPTEPTKFTIAHRVFGASNIIKFLQELPESQRADAVTSMVYEASSRIRDPVYGCAGAIFQLQKQVNELQAQLAKTQAQIMNMHTQQANLVALLCMEMKQSPQDLHYENLINNNQLSPQQQESVLDDFISTPLNYHHNNNGNFSNINPCFIDESNYLSGSTLEPLWT